jgi:DNA invertase Pin-like site-specific DNA recombinase
VQHSDRLARGDGLLADHLGELFFWSRRNGVRLRSVQDDSNFDDVIRAVLIGERNTEDSRRKSEATKSGVRRRAEKGLYHGGPSPYGYEFVRDRNDANDRGRLVVVADEAAVVRRIYTEYLAGAGTRKIAYGLSAESLAPPSAKKQTGRRVAAARWDGSQVANMLSSPVYAGYVPADDELVEAQHELIIDRSTWHEAQRLRAAKRQAHGGGAGRAPVGRHLLVKGLLRCGLCGGAMRPRTYRNRNLEVYLCTTRDGHRGGETCSMRPIERAHVDETLLQYFEEVALDLEATRAQLASAADRSLVEVRARREAAEREVMLANERILRVRRAFQDGKLDADDWRDQRRELEAEQVAADGELAARVQREAEVARDAHVVDAESELVRRLAELREAVAGRITGSVEVDALRAAFTAVFSRVDLVVSDDGERDLVPYVRADPTWAPTDEQVAAIRAAVAQNAPPPAGSFPRLKTTLALTSKNNAEISSALSAGTNDLLKLGASPLTRAADLLSCFGLESEPAAVAVEGAAGRLLELLREAPAGADELARRAGLDAGATARALVELELAGLAAAGDGVYRVTPA